MKAQLPFKTQGHSLVKIFGQMKKTDQDEIIEYVCWESRDREKDPDAVHINACKSKEDFFTLLNESSNIFIDARYIRRRMGNY